jgi:hypothetical protein
MQKPVGRPSNSAPGVGTVNTPLRYCENISLNILPYSPINGGISHEDAFTIALKVRGRNVHIRAPAPGSGRAFGVGGLTGQSGTWPHHKTQSPLRRSRLETVPAHHCCCQQPKRGATCGPSSVRMTEGVARRAPARDAEIPSCGRWLGTVCHYHGSGARPY